MDVFPYFMEEEDLENKKKFNALKVSELKLADTIILLKKRLHGFLNNDCANF
jgi:hypothetical protein